MFLDLVIPRLPWCFRYWSSCFSGTADVGSTVNSASGTSGLNHCCCCHRAGATVQLWARCRNGVHTLQAYSCPAVLEVKGIVLEAASSSSLDLSTQYCIPTTACIWRHPWASWSIFDQTVSLSHHGQTQQLWKCSECCFNYSHSCECLFTRVFWKQAAFYVYVSWSGAANICSKLLMIPEVLFTVCIQMLSLTILTQPLVLQVILHVEFLLPFEAEFCPRSKL